MSAVYAKDQPAGFKNRIEKVAIVGAGGYMGGHIVSALLKGGKHQITAITRADSKNTLPDGVARAPVDYSKPETIVSALRGQDFLVITLNVRAPPETGKILAQAAADAGIKYVMPNLYGPNPFAEDGKMYVDMGFDAGFSESVKAYGAMGLKAVLAPCGFWYEYSLARGTFCYGFDLKESQRKAVFIDKGDVQVYTSTWPQAGRGVAAVLGLPIYPQDETDSSATISQYWYPNAAFVKSFRVSQKDMFESIKRVTKTTDADWSISHEPAKERWENAQKVLFSGQMGTNLDGSPLHPGQAYATRMYTRIFYPTGDSLKPEQIANGVLGLPEEDLDEWTKEAVRLANTGELDKYGL